jgi:transposase
MQKLQERIAVSAKARSDRWESAASCSPYPCRAYSHRERKSSGAERAFPWPAAGFVDTEIGCRAAMQRRKFSREFKFEAVRVVRERGVSAAQAARDLDVHENVLRKWVKELSAASADAFPGHGQMKPEQLEIDRLGREIVKLKAERDILKKAAAFFAREAK